MNNSQKACSGEKFESSLRHILSSASGNESLSAGYKQDTKLGFIVKAIYTLAHSLHHMQEELCGDTSKGVCDKMKPFNGKLYRVKIYF